MRREHNEPDNKNIDPSRGILTACYLGACLWWLIGLAWLALTS